MQSQGSNQATVTQTTTVDTNTTATTHTSTQASNVTLASATTTSTEATSTRASSEALSAAVDALIREANSRAEAQAARHQSASKSESDTEATGERSRKRARPAAVAATSGGEAAPLPRPTPITIPVAASRPFLPLVQESRPAALTAQMPSQAVHAAATELPLPAYGYPPIPGFDPFLAALLPARPVAPPPAALFQPRFIAGGHSASIFRGESRGITAGRPASSAAASSMPFAEALASNQFNCPAPGGQLIFIPDAVLKDGGTVVAYNSQIGANVAYTLRPSHYDPYRPLGDPRQTHLSNRVHIQTSTPADHVPSFRI